MNQNKEQILDQIQQILERGLFLSQYSKKYKELYKKKELGSKKALYKSPNRTMIIVQNVLYSEESLLGLKTLLSGTKEEAKFETLIEELKNQEAMKEFKKIKDKYKNTPLGDFRDKIIAHKDKENIGDPITVFFNPIEDKWLNKSIYFYEELNALLHKYFDPISNNVFVSWYKDSFDYLYTKLEKDEE